MKHLLLSALLFSGSFAISQGFSYDLLGKTLIIQGERSSILKAEDGTQDNLYQFENDSLFIYSMNSNLGEDSNILYLYFKDAVALQDISLRDLRIVPDEKDRFRKRLFALEIFTGDNKTNEFTSKVFTSWDAGIEQGADVYSYTAVLFHTKKEAATFKKKLLAKISEK